MKITIFAALFITTAMSWGATIDRADRKGTAVETQKRDPIEISLGEVKSVGHQAIVVDLLLKNQGSTPLRLAHKGRGRLSYRLEDAKGKVYDIRLTPLFDLPRDKEELRIKPGGEHTLRCELRPQHWFDAPCPIMSHTFFLPKGVRPFAKGERNWVYPVKLTATLAAEVGEHYGAPDAYHSKTATVAPKKPRPDGAPDAEPEGVKKPDN